MASVLTTPASPGDSERRASKDISHLCVTMDSFSPFPSPSSSFVPPPVPEAHEFATRLSLPASRKNSSARVDGSGHHTQHHQQQQKQKNANGDIHSSGRLSQHKSNAQSESHMPPPSVTPSSVKRSSSPPQAVRQPLDNDVEEGTVWDPTSLRGRHTSLSSLSSTRPAPLSPSVSRRTSTAASNSSRQSKDSRRQSSQLLMTPTQSPQPQQHRRRSIAVKIRDFAFASSDIRHVGDGPDAPHNRARRGSGIENDQGSGRMSGWSAFKWSLPGRLFGFSSFGGSGRNSLEASDASYPSNSDLSRNFETSDACEEDGEGEAECDEEKSNGDEDDDDDDDDEGGYPDTDTPLLPGLYRAAFTFEPEGAAEMALVEGQIVRVIGRGGGVGWAIAVRGDSDSAGAGSHALVPESYLEAYKLD